MKYFRAVSITVLALALSTPVLAVDKDAKDRISELQAQVKNTRMEIKAIREHDRVEKAVNRFCSTQDNPAYVICNQGPWVEGGVSGTSSKSNRR